MKKKQIKGRGIVSFLPWEVPPEKVDVILEADVASVESVLKGESDANLVCCERCLWWALYGNICVNPEVPKGKREGYYKPYNSECFKGE